MRLFIAIDLDAGVREKVLREAERLRRFAPEAKWVNPAGMHVTLAFIGHLPDDRVPEVKAIVQEVASGHAPLTLRAEGIGGFGASRHPRVLWIGLGGEISSLGNIKAELDQRLLPIGYQPEKRPFKPHLTLARARKLQGDSALARCIEEHKTVDFGESRVDRLILFRSELSPKGARYTPLIEAPLSGGPAPFPLEAK